MTTDPKAAPASVAEGAAIEMLREVREWFDDAHMHRHTLIAAIDELLAAAPLPPAASDTGWQDYRGGEGDGSVIVQRASHHTVPPAASDERAEFRAWWQSEGHYATEGGSGDRKAWAAWQAARARTPVASVEAQGAAWLAGHPRHWPRAQSAPTAQPPATGATVALAIECLEWHYANPHPKDMLGFRQKQDAKACRELKAAAPTIATPPEATDWLAGTVDCDGNPLVTVRDDHLRIAIEFLDVGRGPLQTLKGETRESIGAKLRSQIAATPPEVAPTDDACAAGWNAAMHAAVTAVDKLGNPHPDSSYNDGVEDCLAAIRAIAASPAANTEGKP